MISTSGLAKLKLNVARERCAAIQHATARFRARTESSPATRNVITFVAHCAAKIDSYLASQRDIDILTPTEAERRIHRATQYVPTLHYLLGIVERSDVTSVPPELASPLRRLMLTIYRDEGAELIVTSSTDLNYSVIEISRTDLQSLFEELDLSDADFADFPATLFIATLPSLEYDQALQHCIFAHELSHPLWLRTKIAERLGPFKVNKVKIAEIIQTLKAQAAQLDASQATLPLETIGLVARVPDRVQRATLNWCKELASDLFGLTLFGPSFVFSLIHFLGSFVRLDSGSETHPPPRLRLKLLFILLDGLYDDSCFSDATTEFLDDWRSIANEPIVVDGLINDLVLWTIRVSDVETNLPALVRSSLAALSPYTADRYKVDIARLCPLIDLQIPPAQYLDESHTYVETDFVAILSAGWETYLNGLGTFKSTLPTQKVGSSYDLAREFNGFLLKAFELNEAAISWKEAKRADDSVE